MYYIKEGSAKLYLYTAKTRRYSLQGKASKKSDCIFLPWINDYILIWPSIALVNLWIVSWKVHFSSTIKFKRSPYFNNYQADLNNALLNLSYSLVVVLQNILISFVIFIDFILVVSIHLSNIASRRCIAL